MLGALAGAYLFRHLNFRAFLFPCFILCFTLFFDIFRLRVKRFYTHLLHRIKEE